jgi:hypothetical protein
MLINIALKAFKNNIFRNKAPVGKNISQQTNNSEGKDNLYVCGN